MKKIALRTLIGSVALSALLGIFAILAGDFGEFEIRVLLTSLIISGVSILVMACGAAREGGGLGGPSRLGIWLALATGALTVIGLWGEIREDDFWKVTGSLAIASTALAHVALTSLARLSTGARPVQLAVYGLSMILAALLVAAIFGQIDSEGFYRAVAILSILLTAGTIAVPILHRMNRMEAPAPAFPLRPLFCPMCGASLAASEDRTQCHECGARFRVVPLP
jgi:hypothetical protein